MDAEQIPNEKIVFVGSSRCGSSNNDNNDIESIDNNNVNSKNNDNNDSCDTGSLSETDQLGLDFGILVSCDHLIISYSTLGMWAGHLNGGTKVMALGLEGYEEAVKSADFPNWHFFTDD